ncbi:MAG TPA: hypothetical protein VF486_20700 [Actinomycetes bacterium]
MGILGVAAFPGQEFWALRIQCAMFPHALFCSNVTEGVRANILVIPTITVAGPAHELQEERDLLAARLADNG